MLAEQTNWTDITVKKCSNSEVSEVSYTSRSPLANEYTYSKRNLSKYQIYIFEKKPECNYASDLNCDSQFNFLLLSKIIKLLFYMRFMQFRLRICIACNLNCE
jgi:hypothetical protein